MSQQHQLESRSCCCPCCCLLLLLLRLTVRYPVLLLCCCCDADVAVVTAVENNLAQLYYFSCLFNPFYRSSSSACIYRILSFINLHLKCLSFVVAIRFQGDNLMSLYFTKYPRTINFLPITILFHSCSPQKITFFG